MSYTMPKELYYTREHEWARVEEAHVRIGVDDYAQKSLHEIVYVEVLPVGTFIDHMGKIGTVESIKAVSEVFSPISGEITEVNDRLTESPELVNQDPYGEGWIAKIRATNLKADLKNLMTADQYADYIKNIKGK